jgi:hypothetical protein
VPSASFVAHVCALCGGAVTERTAPTCAVEQLGEEGALNVFSQKHNKWHTFKFDRVFGEGSTQDDVYAETQPLIRSVLDGGRRASRACCCLGGHTTK